MTTEIDPSKQPSKIQVAALGALFAFHAGAIALVCSIAANSDSSILQAQKERNVIASCNQAAKSASDLQSYEKSYRACFQKQYRAPGFSWR
jgi:hypothetical protein